MSSQFDSPRGLYPHEYFACFAGLLFMFVFAHFMSAAAGAYWSDLPAGAAVAYGLECGLILICIARATAIRAEHKVPLLLLASVLIVVHFVVFALPQVLSTAEPEGLFFALHVVRVMFYFTSASIGYWLACMMFFRGRREVLFASIAPSLFMTAGAWWVLRDEPGASRAFSSVAMGLGFAASGLLLFGVSHIPALRSLFSNRPTHHLYTELQNAKRVHESMFPEPVSAESYRFGYAYRPMRQIGGDFIHAYRGESGRASQGAFYLTLIDVTGHGISSALTVNRLHAEIRQYFASADEPCPSEALGYLNEYVRLTMAEHGLFATGMCVKVDAARGSLTLANAGHPFCYYRSASGLQAIKAEGPMLGVFSGETFDSAPVSLAFEPGDQLVMVTDGAIESKSPAGEAIGTDRLRRIIERSCLRAAPLVNEGGTEGLLQRRLAGRLLDRSDVRKPVGLIQQVLRNRMNQHPCALADEIMLSIDDFVQQDNQDDILIATIELLKGASTKTSADRVAVEQAEDAVLSEA